MLNYRELFVKRFVTKTEQQIKKHAIAAGLLPLLGGGSA